MNAMNEIEKRIDRMPSFSVFAVFGVLVSVGVTVAVLAVLAYH